MTITVYDNYAKKKKKRNTDMVTEGKATTDAELEREYNVDSFYGFTPFFIQICLIFIGINVVLFFFLPGARNFASVNIVFFSSEIALRSYIHRCKGSKQEAAAIKQFHYLSQVLAFTAEIFQARDNSLSSEEGINSHISMVILTMYFLAFLFFRISKTRTKAFPLVDMIVIPGVVWKYPRFGIFEPHYEALAFFVAGSLGNAIGFIINEMRWMHFLAIHEKDRELQKKIQEIEKQRRDMKRTIRRSLALEEIACSQESSFIEIIR